MHYDAGGILCTRIAKVSRYNMTAIQYLGSLTLILNFLKLLA